MYRYHKISNLPCPYTTSIMFASCMWIYTYVIIFIYNFPVFTPYPHPIFFRIWRIAVSMSYHTGIHLHDSKLIWKTYIILATLVLKSLFVKTLKEIPLDIHLLKLKLEKTLPPFSCSTSILLKKSIQEPGSSPFSSWWLWILNSTRELCSY